MEIKDYLLQKGEYYTDIVDKTMIFIHHTAGSHRPDFTIDGWERDASKSGGQLAVATAYVIGGISTTDKSALFDGKVYRAFDDKYWAHHLSMTSANNKELNMKSIGIEVCNYGPVTKTKDGTFLNYVNKAVPADMVTELAEPFRGFKYYQKYTPKQLEVLGLLLKDIAQRHNIDLNKGLKSVMGLGAKGFETNLDAQAGKEGLWSHSSVRKDKFDMFPQPELINLIKSL